MNVTITGIKEARAYCATLGSGAEAAARSVVLVGTNLVYGYGIEFGRHRGGRLARRAGGARYLTNALRQVAPRIPRAIADALPKGPSAVLSALLRLGYDVEGGAKTTVPVITGRLRRSIHTTAGRRGG